MKNENRKRRVSKVKQGREFYENRFALIKNRQTNVREEGIFQVEF